MISFLIIVILVGIIFGIVLAALFQVYSVRTSRYVSYKIFGFSLKDVLIWISAFLCMIVLTVLIGLSVIVNNHAYIVSNPWRFTTELCIAALLPACSIAFVGLVRNRMVFTQSLGVLFLVSFVEFGSIHLLMQLSGIYDMVVFGS